MFSKFQPPLHPTPQYLNHHLAVTTTSDDTDDIEDSIPTNPTPSPHSRKQKTSNNNEDEATIEVAARPRGRPPGSKNKPKTPIIIIREPEPSMSPHILEVAGGVDIVESLTRYTRRHGIGLCVISASGTISGVSLRHPFTATPRGIYTVHGRYDILSLSTVLLAGGGGGQNRNGSDPDHNHSHTHPHHQCHNHNNNNQRGGTNNGNVHDGVFTISVTGPRGQIVGGKVVGALLAAGTVYVMAASFRCPPNCQKLPIDINEDVMGSSSGGGGCCGGKGNDCSGVSSGGGDGGHTTGGDGDSCASLGIYSLGGSSGGNPDVLWAPMAARPAPPFCSERY
ncbi:hypothetical protein Droror1_Dr00004983 [Drosera rotundifolia]